MAQTRLTLHGMEATLRALKRAPEVVKRHAAGAVGRSSISLAHQARLRAPVGVTGELKRSIEWIHQDGALTGWVGINESSPARRYWYFVEMGTIHAAAQPFLRPAAEASEAGFIQQMREIGPDVEREMGE